MAESPSSASRTGTEWLPALGGARLLRLAPGGGEPGTLILRTAAGAEHRIDAGPRARFGRQTEYLVPAGLSWLAAFLEWPDGTRAAVPAPPARAPAAAVDHAARRTGAPHRAEVIELRARRPAAEPPSRPAAAGAWTAPPQTSGAPDAPSRAELTRALAARDSLQNALTVARADLRAARAAREADASALATLAAELDAERTAHRVTRGTLATLAEALTAARTARVAAEPQTAAAASRDPGPAPARRAVEAAAAGDPASLERHARHQLEAATAAARRPQPETGRLLENLEAAAAALRATTEPRTDPPPPASTPGPLVAEASTAASPAAAAPGPSVTDPAGAASAPPAGAGPAASVPPRAEPSYAAASPAAAVSPSAISTASPWLLARPDAPATSLAPERRLRKALVELAKHDPVAGGALLAALLPAQGAALAGEITYDLTIRGVGTFAVSGRAGAVALTPLARPRGRKLAAFHLQADPHALAELTAGTRKRPRRFGRAARLSGRRGHFDQLHDAIATTRLSLADAVKAGARLDPRLVFKALPHAIPPEWTTGHVFTVQQQILELAPRAWYVIARDGVPLTVVEHVQGAAADATVSMTRATFDRLLRGEPSGGGELPIIRGDRAAVAALKGWIDEASGAVRDR